MAKTGVFYDSDIALMEHQLITESNIEDFRPEDLQMFLMGVNSMAQKIIDAIEGK